MAFRLPTFNLTVNIFRFGNKPPGTGPDLVTIGNLSVGRRVSQPGYILNVNPNTGQVYSEYNCMSLLLLPRGTDVRPGWLTAPLTPNHADWIEVPAGTGLYWYVASVQDVARGFPNEYRRADIIPVLPWPVPIP